jgi:hypothetical protein
MPIDRSRLQPSPQLFYGRVLTFDAAKHIYRYDGEIVPSVTGVLRRVSKGDGLVQWAANTAAEYYDAHLERWRAGEISREELSRSARRAWREKRSEAGDIGTRVHAYVEALLRGEEPAPCEGDREARARQAVDEWLARNEIAPINLERRVYSYRYGYAGTCDFLGLVNGRLVVLDFKTGKSIYDDLWWQLAAYDLALREELGRDCAPAAHYLIHLDKATGTMTPHSRPPSRDATEAWIRLVQFHRAANRAGVRNAA